jgi:hypothetical protein
MVRAGMTKFSADESSIKNGTFAVNGAAERDVTYQTAIVEGGKIKVITRTREINMLEKVPTGRIQTSCTHARTKMYLLTITMAVLWIK